MKPFDHKGFAIVVEASGLFRVSDRPDIPACVSLVLAKEAIDIALKRERKPIAALMFAGKRYDRDSDGIAEVTVTSTAKSRWGSSEAWIRTKNGGRSKEACDAVYLDTPANRKVMEECVKLTAEARVIDQKIEKLRHTLARVPVEGGAG
jgi:hypothetical protein